MLFLLYNRCFYLLTGKTGKIQFVHVWGELRKDNWMIEVASSIRNAIFIFDVTYFVFVCNYDFI